MLIIADSGSTKTHWRLANKKGNLTQFQSMGLNPWYQDDLTFQTVVNGVFEGIDLHRISTVYFYGAGVTPGTQYHRVKSLLQNLFKKAEIHVFDDITGAVRATCNGQPGITSVLGTGSNTCYSDGHKVIRKQPALGYVLGDEGSGAHLGKLLLKAYLQGDLPVETEEKFQKRYALERTDVLQRLAGEHPNRFLASFSKFIWQHRHSTAVQELILAAFKAFFEEQIIKYPNYREIPLHLVGSVGYYYADFIRKAGKEFGVYLGTIIGNPIAAITLYHLKI